MGFDVCLVGWFGELRCVGLMFYEAARSAIGLRGHRGRRIRRPTAQSGRRSSAQGLLCPLCACWFRAGSICCWFQIAWICRWFGAGLICRWFQIAWICRWFGAGLCLLSAVTLFERDVTRWWPIWHYNPVFA